MYRSRPSLGTCAAIILLGLSCCVTCSDAGIIRSSTSISGNTLGQFSSNAPSRLIDQTGLSANFVSGVTDFSTYLSGNPTHNSFLGPNFWIANFVTTGQIHFDLGASFTISQLLFWNRDGGGTFGGIKDFTVLTDDNASFSSPTNVGSFSAPIGADAANSVALLFDLTDSAQQFVRLDIQSAHGTGAVAAGEVAFDTSGSAIPEPSTLTLLCTGTVSILGYC